VTLAALIRRRETGSPANDNPAKVANDGQSRGKPLARLAALALANSQEAETVAPDPEAELRRQRVLAMLQESPTITYAAVTDTDSNPDVVIVALAIRGRASCELLIPRDRYDGVLLLDLIERHGATVH
jgi:hypothetical protein